MNKTLFHKGKVTIAVLMAVLSALLCSQAFAAAPPSVTKLLSVQTPGYPTMSAADSSGTLFVGDYYGKAVHIFNPDGSYRDRIFLSAPPTALAVSPDNLLYVGQSVATSGYIEIFSRDGRSQSKINGFSMPVSISFQGASIFVVDGHQLVKLSAAGVPLQAFGGVGTFIDPKSVAGNAQAGEVYVLDRGQLITPAGDQSPLYMKNTPVWRVQVFNAADITSGPIRSFSNYGFNLDGKVGSASSMTADAAGRIYISDNTQNIIAVFDAATSTFLSTIADGSGTMNPLRLDFNAASGRLYVTSGAKYIAVFGIDVFAALSVSPATLSIPYQAGAGDLQKALALTNTGSAVLGWTAASSVSWLAITPAGGQINGNANQAVTVNIVASETSGFAPGSQYSGNINFSYNGGSVVVPVTVRMVDQPILAAAPAVINASKKIHETVPPADIVVTVQNDVTGTKAWTAASNVDWLTVTTKSVKTTTVNDIVTTTTAAQVNISADPASIINRAAGTYKGNVTISATGVTGSPAVITVNLVVTTAGAITVTTNSKDAAFTVTGPATVYHGTGQNYVIDNAAPGDYSVTYSQVSGYRTPAAQKQTLSPGQSITFNGNYSDIRSRMNIVASHGEGSRESSEVAVFDADGNIVLQFTPFQFKYGANTAVGDVDGDGINDIIVGSGGGNKVPAAVKGFRRDGTPIPGLAFTAFAEKTGVVVAAADFDGDGKAEIVAADASTGTTIRILSFDKTQGTVVDTGVLLEAFPGQTGGVNIAVADVDGDGIPELITSLRRGSGNQDVKIFKINTTAGSGSWIAELSGSFTACPGSASRSVTTGAADSTMALAMADTNADGLAEIVVVCNSAASADVKIFNAAGDPIGTIPAVSKRPEFVAAGDLNMDGSAEIVLGDMQPGGATQVQIFDTKGQLIKGFNPFANSLGVKVTVGNLGY